MITIIRHKMFLDFFRLMVVTTFVVMTMSCSSERDSYLRGLGLEVEPLEAVDSINIDQYDLFQVRDVARLDEKWLAVSSVKGDYNLLFLNTDTHEHFFALRRGRGPEEIIQGSSLHKSGESAVYYDFNNATCVKVHVGNAMADGIRIDTIGVFDHGPEKPVNLVSVNDEYFISGNLLNDDVWYCSYDNGGRVLSTTPALAFDEMSQERDRRLSFLVSSRYTVSPDCSKVCVANLLSPSLSFSHISSGVLTEYMRKPVPPRGMVGGHITPDFISAFYGIASSAKYVYVIYSGKKRTASLPANECNHLIVYDWDGNPVKHYYLNRNVCSIHVDCNDLWAASAYPESCVYRFVLDLP